MQASIAHVEDRREFTSDTWHYDLLQGLARQHRGRAIIDIGTQRGSSALALSAEPSNHVHSFDIADTCDRDRWQGRSNISFHLQDVVSDGPGWDEHRALILGSALIFLDIDPHEGVMELAFYHRLKQEGYKGLLVCDDIWYFKGMRDNFWYHVPSSEKRDVTPAGHFSGTGLIRVSGVWGDAVDNDNDNGDDDSWKAAGDWTVVTAYFDLTKEPDASPEIKARPDKHYLDAANMTMALESNLVVFCDAASESRLRALRPVHLLERTRYVVREFSDFALVKEWGERVGRLKQNKDNWDARMTGSYYLFCMLRYVMLLEVMSTNPFGSSFFAWCNVCIERMGWASGKAFAGIWSERRERFSSCYIDYRTDAYVADEARYFYEGKCSFCSGFFTGSEDYMARFCRLVLVEFERAAAKGLGHADEQLFSIVYKKHSWIFEPYLGDYQQMITNYCGITERPEVPVHHFLSSLHASAENWPLLRRMASLWLDSCARGLCVPVPGDVAIVMGFLRKASRHVAVAAATRTAHAYREPGTFLL